MDQQTVKSRRPNYRKAFAHNVLKEFVYKYVGTRRAIRTEEIHWEVINDYGSVTVRHIYRILAELVNEKKIVRVPGTPKYTRTRESAEKTPCGYVRYNSPLIWEDGGLALLSDSLEHMKVYSEHKSGKPVEEATGIEVVEAEEAEDAAEEEADEPVEAAA